MKLVKRQVQNQIQDHAWYYTPSQVREQDQIQTFSQFLHRMCYQILLPIYEQLLEESHEAG